ncbi:methyl-accepting chemotaxis protein [Oribacterium sp. WCC10]|uniref:methyl-accepting chemotaxis protein n=1 Tax=Oribacterium sp. WCC10 TaxID=1855343 RepID=UPI0008ED1458|nr:methyl-accepting chemotaxis protein [Oribacterium sp. WCC10]SFG79597.1 methyl-accepting chemotaxis protein [Oribacterium sp. WCC10]
MKLKDLSIKTRFMITQIVITVLIAVMMLVALFSFHRMSSMMTRFGNVEYENTYAGLLVKKDLNATAKRLLLALYQSDIEGNSPADQRKDFESRFATMQSYLDQIIKTSDDTAMSSDLQNKFDTFTAASYQLLNTIETGDMQASISYYDANFSTDNSSPMMQFTHALDDVCELCEQQAKDMLNDSAKLSTTVMVTIPLTFVITVVACTIIFTFLANSIIKGVNVVVDSMKTLEKGEFDVDIDPSKFGKDEIGAMVHAVHGMSTQTSNVIKDVCYMLMEMAKGNFAAKSQCADQYIGDYASIITAYGDIHSNLSAIFTKMNDVAADVETGSSHIANGAMSLSQGSTEQASTLEELSATVQTIRDKVNINAKTANDVGEFSASFAERISAENEQMGHVKEAMEEIANKSNQIENIIKTIDDIAFQTNILALNAAVEAARAGAAGKGFAVVADEVRNLAGKSAAAASETSVLIEDTITAIQNGNKLITASADSLNEVKESSEKSKELVLNIANEMQREAVSIAEITTGLEQIAQVVQENSATAEQSSASSQELNNHATQLKNMVAQIIV